MTCVDCNVTFEGDDYRQHISCISEAEKYEGALYRGPKPKAKKMSAQEVWMEVVEQAAADSQTAPAPIRSLVSNLSGYDNVPRNKGKFFNFLKNSLKVGVTSHAWRERCHSSRVGPLRTSKGANLGVSPATPTVPKGCSLRVDPCPSTTTTCAVNPCSSS